MASGKRERRYKLYWVPNFEIRTANYDHANEPAAFIAEIAASISAQGMRNPLFVRITQGVAVIHPGKCRAKALLSLGRLTAPAVVQDLDKVSRNWQELTPDEAAAKFGGDCVVSYSHKGFCVSKIR